MKKRLHPDVYVGSICLAGSLFFLIKTFDLPSGPNVFPFISLGFMILFSVIIMIGRFRKTKAAGAENKDVPRAAPIPWKIWLALTVYCILFWICGYMIATLIFLIAAMFILHVRSWKIILCVTVSYLVIAYLLFAVQFNTPIDRFGLIGEYLARI